MAKKQGSGGARGRPEGTFKIDSAIVQKIIEVLRIDGTIDEACGYAQISKQTHYNWIDAKAIFLDEILVIGKDGKEVRKSVEKLYEDAVIEAEQYAYIFARKSLFKSVTSGNPAMALEFLKRRDPRYKDKSDNTLKGDPDSPLVQIFIPDNKRDTGTKDQKKEKSSK